MGFLLFSIRSKEQHIKRLPNYLRDLVSPHQINTHDLRNRKAIREPFLILYYLNVLSFILL